MPPQYTNEIAAGGGCHNVRMTALEPTIIATSIGFHSAGPARWTGGWDPRTG